MEGGREDRGESRGEAATRAGVVRRQQWVRAEAAEERGQAETTGSEPEVGPQAAEGRIRRVEKAGMVAAAVA